jgi:antitoxin component YwqK of YwqJK toxin-antitoxin module
MEGVVVMSVSKTFKYVAAAAMTFCGSAAWAADDAADSTQTPVRTVERPTVTTAPRLNANIRSSNAKVPGGEPVIDMGKVEKVNDRYPNGKIKVEREVGTDSKGNYVNQGSYKAFDPDGAVMMTGEFLNGRQNGKWMQKFAKDDGHLFSPDGDAEFTGPFTSEATFLDGQLHGQWTIKDASGQNIIEWSFENGVRNGIWTWWHNNGKKRLEATYRSGQLNGDVQEWDNEEKLVSKNTYIDGKLLVKVTGWYTIGQKHYEGYYLKSDDMPETTYDWWKSMVNTGATPNPTADLKHGSWVSWYRNGAKQTEAQYDHDARIGKFKWWYENGQPEAEGDYEAGKRIGAWITWHPNGLKESQGDFKDDKLISKWIHWDEDGKLVEAKDPTRGGQPQVFQPTQQQQRATNGQRPSPAVSSR